MKNTIVILGLLLTARLNYAQDCEGYFPLSKGAVMETTTYNDKGKPQTTVTLTIKEVVKTSDGVKVDVHSEIKDEKGKELATADYDAKCSGNSFFINMKSMITADQLKAFKDMTVSMEADDLDYPINATEGQVLKDAHLKMQSSMNGMNMPATTIDITDRKVTGRETITTPAGTFECIKVSSTVKFKNIIGYEVQTIEWLSKGNGVIRTESFKGDKRKSYSELTKLVK